MFFRGESSGRLFVFYQPEGAHASEGEVKSDTREYMQPFDAMEQVDHDTPISDW